MIGFYRGFEKRSGIFRSIGNILGAPMRGLKGSTKGSINALSREGAEGASDVVAKKLREEVLPDLAKAVEKAKETPFTVAPDLKKLTSFKGGILPALAVGGSFEGGRQGAKGIANLFKKPKDQNPDTVK